MKFKVGDKVVDVDGRRGVIYRLALSPEHFTENQYYIEVTEGVRQGSFYMASESKIKLDQTEIRVDKLNNLGI